MRTAALAASVAALVASLLAVFFTSDVVPLPHNTEVPGPRLAHRVLVVVFDGLRYDTALETTLMPNLRKLADEGASGLAMATEVTMTEVGVRTLGTGATPSLVDYLFPRARAHLDSPLDALGDAGGRFALIGTGTWKKQFGRAAHIVVNDTSHHCFRNVLGNCPDQVYVEQALAVMATPDWDLLVVHLPGIDSASHRFTAFTEAFRNKARDADRLLGVMVEAAGADATVLVTSDHGSGERGHHGSGEPSARKTPIVLHGPGIRPVRDLAIAQNDFAPTLSVLLGLPIPSSSEGVVPLDALALSPEQRVHVAEANRAQLERYVDAFARLRKVSAPAVPVDDLRAASRFLATARARSSTVPLLWATVLGLCAVVLLVRRDGATSLPGRLAWGLLLVDATLAVAFQPRSVMLGLVGIGLAACGLWLESRPPVPRRVVVPVTALLALEALIGLWRVNRRESQLAVIALGSRLRAEEDATFALFVVALAVIAAIALRWRARRLQMDPWLALVAILAITAAGDTLALPVGIGAGVLVALVAVQTDALPALLVLLAAGATALGLERYVLPEHALLGALGPLLCGGAALVRSRARSRSTLGVLGALTLAATAVRAAGAPAGPYTVVVVAGALAVVAAPFFVPRAERLELLGWTSFVLISLLCQPIQITGVLVVALAARASTQLLRTDDRELRIFRGVLFAIAARLALLAVFERSFSFSRLEIWLAFMGNESGERFALVVILLKLTLAFLVAVALVTAELDANDARRVIMGCGAFLLLRVGHIVLSMTIARGTYYSPNADAGPLLFNLFMAASLLVVAGLVRVQAWTGPRTRVRVADVAGA